MVQAGTSRFNRVLVATDLCAGGRRALQRALLLPLNSHAIIRLVHVSDHRAAPGKHETELLNALLSEAAWAESNSEVPVQVERQLLRGRIFHEIAKCARETDAEIILLGGDRARGPWSRGTAATLVARKSRRPVLIARLPPTEYHRAIAAVALSGDEDYVLSPALKVIGGTDAKIDLLHAWSLPHKSSLALSSSWQQLRSDEKQEHESARRALNSAARQVSKGAHLGRVRLRHGHAVNIILREAQARNAQLLVLGSSAKTGFEEAMAGGVADALLASLDRDVLLARPEQSGREA